MKGIDRRRFIKLACLTSVIGLTGKTGLSILAPDNADAAVKEMPLTGARKWGMVVDMHKMNDDILRKCRDACHSFHNVPEWDDPRIEIKWIWGETFDHSFPGQGNEYLDEGILQKNYPVLCNHCDNPPCCRVCPTKATFKGEDGIVVMDPHRCIGCRYCMVACPYGARSFNYGDPRKAPDELNSAFPSNPDYPTRTKGVVEKCNFCAERLAKGEMPVCVEAANGENSETLIFGDLSDQNSKVRMALRANYTIRRKPELGTGPNIFYVVG
jgi:Fe-S-cluster-containing dehydrogenase component